MTTSSLSTPSDFGRLEQQILSADEQGDVARAESIAERLTSGAHLDDWLALAPALMAGRRLAMKVSASNTARGRRYADAFTHWLRLHPALNAIAIASKHSVTALLWLHDTPERIETLARIRAEMTPGERSRFATPMTAMARVRAELEGPGKASQEESKKRSGTLAEQLVAAEAEIETLRKFKKDFEDRREWGGQIDIEKDSERDIVAVCKGLMAQNPRKWSVRIHTIAKAMLKAVDGEAK